MTSPIWQLDEQGARLRVDRFSARLGFDHLERGLTDLRVEPFSLHVASMLGLALPASAETTGRGPLHGYERGRDLVAACRQSGGWPVRVDAVWRAISPAEASDIVAGVDLIVSVETDLLDSRPGLTIRSELTPIEVLRLVAPAAASFEPCRLESPSPIALKIGSPDCFAFRLPDVPFTYGEMSHPADSYGTLLGPASDGPQTVEVRHRLFAERLEKGVILRARVRGVLVDRADDLRTVAACYAAFATADPPLGS